MQKSANFFIKKLCFPRFNKLYVLISLALEVHCIVRRPLPRNGNDKL